MKDKFNIAVILVMVFMLIPSFFVSLHSQKSTNHSLSKTTNTVVADKVTPEDYWTTVPQRPVALKTIKVYSDENLSKTVGEISAHTQLNLTELKNQAFKMKDGRYIAASKAQIVSDVPLSRKKVTTPLYTTKRVNVFYSPLTTYDQEVLTAISGNHQFVADKIAQTYWGSYYEIALSNGQKGWVSSDDISLVNPKLQKVQTLLQKKYKDKKYSIYVKELNDNSYTAGVNEDEKMYSASLSKLPILYWTQKRLNEGSASLEDQLLYRTAVNTFYGSYKPAGTGNLPKTADNKNYSLQDVINRTAKLSDNVGSNLLAYYETDQFSTSFQDAITQIAGTPWNPKEREASAKMVGKVLEALYNEGGASFNALFNTAFDDVKIRAGVPKNIPVAHKIGGAGSDNHDAAIIFTEQPYLLVIETDGATDEQIQTISQEIYEVMK